MKESLNTKRLLITPPAAKVNNAPFTSAIIDTAGWSQLEVQCLIGDIDVPFAGLKLQESDDPAMTGATDIPGTVGGVNFPLPSAAADNTVNVFHVDLRGRKRYIKLIATGGSGTAGTFMTATAILSRPAISPSTARGRGADGFEVQV